MTKPGVVGTTGTESTRFTTAGANGVPALDTDYFQDPEAVHAALREEGPARKVVLPHGWETWIVTRYDEARAALADPRLLKNGRVLDQYMDPEQLGDEMVFAEALRAHMLSSDPPDHTRLRKLVNKAFTSRRVEALRPRIEAITEELLDAMAARGADGEPVDLIDAFAFPLPMTVICELLGVPFEDREDFRAWSAVVLADDPTDDEVRTASYAMAGYLSQLIAAKRAQPGEDLLTGLVQARDDNDRLDENELIAMAFLLLVAGHETTVNLIGNGVLALLRNPGQLDRLRADPSLVGGAVEEFLRYDGPINLATMRFTSEPVRFGDVEIPRGQFVLVSLASANHDESRFPGAGQLDVTRRGGGHLAFGHGIHYCVGAPLARLEAEVAFRRMLDRFPELSLAVDSDEVRWRHSSLIHGVERLPVRLS
ncbi:Cytochrome P450 [Actinopolymorpha cephalotaxi]|uniref:Cytochrome P450 n=1 Tax=Actinopolymorpha cephalotaxi TaxID=504797 RepID=A0A1I2R809_9ACTN|nr:cytochrome P450 [Actinopolymorpha cephalotaxi]NYH82355.1 cytochrome P450 [Actinopolymorpha cephalotaxi]SFG35649.1 Cytochrome P450 [Actinopolymorpha cephalotaxi]